MVEEAGIPTVYMSTGRDLGSQVLPPRSVFVNFPMGNPFGRPHDTAMQRRILLDALERVERATTPGELVDLPYEWGERIVTIMELRAGDGAHGVPLAGGPRLPAS